MLCCCQNCTHVHAILLLESTAVGSWQPEPVRRQRSAPAAAVEKRPVVAIFAEPPAAARVAGPQPVAVPAPGSGFDDRPAVVLAAADLPRIGLDSVASVQLVPRCSPKLRR